MTPSKDILEAAYPAAEQTVSQPAAPSSKPAGHLRSDAVSLEIPVKIHGSRVTAVARGVTPRTEPFEEQTTTMIVFPQGGVLRMSTVVTVGQMLILTNLKTRQDAICRVVKVRAQSAGSAGYVEVEFTQRQPGYWGVYFSTDGPEATKKVASAPSPAVPATPAKENTAPDASWTPAPPTEVKVETPAPARVAPPAPPQSTFISIGSQEKVQPAATDVPRANAMPPARKISGATLPTEASIAPPAVPLRPLSMEELLADVQPGTIHASTSSSGESGEVADAPVDLPTPSSRYEFESHTSTAGHASEFPDHVESVAARPESGVRVREAKGRGPQQSWMLIAACAALAVAGAGGGYYYLHHRNASPGGSGANRPVVVQQVAQPAVAPAVSAAVSNPAVPAKNASPASHLSLAAQPNPASANAFAAGPNSSNNATAPSAAPSQPSSPAKHAAPSLAKDLAGTMNAHPVSSPSAASQAVSMPSVAAPTISANDAGSLGGASSAASVLPPSATNSQHALAPGGSHVAQPRLVSSVQPTYPAIAAQMRTQGDVIIKAHIDVNGRVAGMKVVSGPSLLQQAALDALRQWKYEPSKLDGQPVPADIQVMIRFRL